MPIAETTSPNPSPEATVTNTVAVIGLVLSVICVGLCGLLFVLVGQLPDGIEDFQQLRSETPTQLRLLILGCSTGVLTLVSLTLSVIALFLPNRPRTLGLIGTIISVGLLLGVFGVLALGIIMNSPESFGESVETPTTTPESEQ